MGGGGDPVALSLMFNWILEKNMYPERLKLSVLGHLTLCNIKFGRVKCAFRTFSVAIETALAHGGLCHISSFFGGRNIAGLVSFC